MKKTIIICLLLLMCLPLRIQAQGQAVGAAVEITQDAVNLFLTTQYNKIGFPSHIEGNVGGISYDITLQLPKVSFHANLAKVHWGIRIKSNILNRDIVFEEPLSIRIGSIDDLTVKGICESFETKIRSFGLNPIIEGAILGAWRALELELYPLTLASQITYGPLLYDMAIKIVDPYFSLSFAVRPQCIRVTVNTYLEGKEYFNASAGRVNSTKSCIRVSSGAQIRVTKAELFDLNMNLVYRYTGNGIIPKGSSWTREFDGNLGTGIYIMRVQLENDRTFHILQYKVPVSNSYYQPSLRVN